jgi:chemotaxis protein CheD
MRTPKRFFHHPNVVTLYPGEFRVNRAAEKVLLHTLLGSCVSACLYDPKARVVGMNHFLLSSQRYAKNMTYTRTEAGRYGIHSMELLINEMLKAGADRGRLQAKAFGGATIMKEQGQDNFFCVGQINMRFIQDFLANEKIPLVASDLGGNQGRVIFFDSESFSVDVRKIVKTAMGEIADAERRHWKKRISQRAEAAARGSVELWD